MQPISFTPWFRDFFRQTWTVTAITVISCAALAAHTMSSIVADRHLTPRSTSPAVAARPALQPALQLRQPMMPRLIERNMFCATCAPPLGYAGEPGVAGPWVPRDAVLIATSVGFAPYATIHVLASDIQGSWGLGETIPGLGRVERIASRWIDIEDAGRHARLRLESVGGGGPAPASDPATAAPSPWSKQITRIDDHTYEVDRALVRTLVSGSLGHDTGRLVPVVEHGQILGIRLYQVTDRTVAHAIGLRNRDTIKAINDAPIQSAQQLLDLYAGLDQLGLVELTIERDGKPMPRTLRLR